MRHPILAAAACVLALALPAHAQRDDKSQPVNFSADAGEVNYQTKVGNLTGNVVITQGTMTIRAERITFRQNADNSISATAHGNPITFRQKRDGVDEYFEGFAQRAEYDGEKEQLELLRNAVREVHVGGKRVVADGRHPDRDAIAARYRQTLQALLAD